MKRKRLNPGIRGYSVGDPKLWDGVKRDMLTQYLEDPPGRPFTCTDQDVEPNECARAKLDNETECRHKCYAHTRWTGR